MKPITFKQLMLILGGLFLLSVISIYLLFISFPTEEMQFERERWLNQVPQRVLMVDDLVRKHPLIGMNREEVLQLLGEPDSEPPVLDENSLFYFIGPTVYPTDEDAEWLKITFQDDQVTEVELLED